MHAAAELLVATRAGDPKAMQAVLAGMRRLDDALNRALLR